MSELRKTASSHTIAANRLVREALPADDAADWADATAGLIAPLDESPVTSAGGAHEVWNLARFASVQHRDAPCPDSVNPGLWRQARLNSIGGLFRVCEGVHQVRGIDLSNITFIEGERGRIVVDPLISVECTRAALDLAARHLGERPVSAMIYTHSHVDHFGGSEAVLDRAIADLPVWAPDRFLDYAVSENVLAGNAMRRRAAFMYGATLPADARGLVDAGLGKTVSAGTVSLVPPNHHVRANDQPILIDGVEFRFHLAPETEAPAEMMFYLPARRALNIADIACAGLHNLYTLRGAEVRDARAWVRALDDALRHFGAQAEILFGGHHWPRFGRERIVEYLVVQRDIYKFIHDQTLRLVNAGLTPREIADTLRPPAELARHWCVRDYYGTVAHNAKAVYQKYIGWFDGHPANLHPLPPVEAGRRYVDFMGGADSLLAKARAALEAGEYRFVAEVLTHLVFAEPDNAEARLLQAEALEQLGYQAESAPWRNIYLTGAQELRRSADRDRAAPSGGGAGSGLTSLLPVDLVFDALAVALDSTRADGFSLRMNWEFPDGDGRYFMELKHGVLHHWRDREETADIRIAISRPALLAVLSGRRKLPELVAEGAAKIDGRPDLLVRFFGLFDRPDPRFAIMKP